MSPSSAVEAVEFPDASPTGNSGGWHHYLVTFDAGQIVGYFDGLPIATNTVGLQALTMSGYYLGIGVRTFNATPELDLSVDLHPNNAWINGRVDDVRIYKRALNPQEVFDLYRSFDTLPPTPPVGLSAVPVSSSQVALKWSPASDLFSLLYVVYRNGVAIATNAGATWFDGGLASGSTHSYHVRALDLGGNLSSDSNVATATTFSGTTVDLIIDDSDGAPWFSPQGSWRLMTAWPGYYGSSSLLDFKDRKGWSLTFTPPLPEPGTYSVYIRYPGLSSQTWQVSTAVPVDIVRQGQTNTVALNQRLNYGNWVLLGQYAFDAGTNGSVRVRTAGTDGFFVLGDAVRFIK
jgi:hypothetical protein